MCVPELQNLFAARNFPAEFFFPENAPDLESRARAALAKGSRVIVAMGGDGTFQAVANAARGRSAVLGLLPAGGGNDVAAALGIPTESPLKAAQLLPSAEPRFIDLLCARTADGRERLYAGGGGLGLDADAARHASNTYRRIRGRLRYVASALRALREFRPMHVRAEFEENGLQPIEMNVLLAAALNTPTYGAGIRLATGAMLDDGLLNAAFVKQLSKPAVLALIPRLTAKGELPEKYVTRVAARRIRLIPDRPCLFHGDGEILGSAPVEIEVLPRAVRVLAPPAIKSPPQL